MEALSGITTWADTGATDATARSPPKSRNRKPLKIRLEIFIADPPPIENSRVCFQSKNPFAENAASLQSTDIITMPQRLVKSLILG